MHVRLPIAKGYHGSQEEERREFPCQTLNAHNQCGSSLILCASLVTYLILLHAPEDLINSESSSQDSSELHGSLNKMVFWGAYWGPPFTEILNSQPSRYDGAEVITSFQPDVGRCFKHLHQSLTLDL